MSKSPFTRKAHGETGRVISVSRLIAHSTMNSVQETRSEVILLSSGSEMAKRYVFRSKC